MEQGPATPVLNSDPAKSAEPLALFVFDGRGDVQAFPSTKAAPTLPPKSFLMVAGQVSAPEFRAWLAAEIGPAFADLMANGASRTRCTVIEDRALVSMRVVRRGDPMEAGEGATVSIFLERGRVIVASDVNIPEVLGLAQWHQARFAPHSPADLVARLGLRAADRLEGSIERAGDVLDDIEEQLLADIIADAPDQLAEVRRSLISFRRIVWPQRDMLTTLEIEDLSFFSSRDRSRLREAAHRSARVAEELQALSERAVLVHEQILDARAEQLNRSLLFLAAVTAIFMPLTLITGLLGMNVAGIPFADSPWAFLVVVLGLAVFAGATVAWLHRKHWI